MRSVASTYKKKREMKDGILRTRRKSGLIKSRVHDSVWMQTLDSRRLPAMFRSQCCHWLDPDRERVELRLINVLRTQGPESGMIQLGWIYVLYT